LLQISIKALIQDRFCISAQFLKDRAVCTTQDGLLILHYGLVQTQK
ncbi:hypothetical protein scyTo_0024118, partial [Scyliorhinus torazame]|nr:hypothetical protein [Scyliorhinus torazame]